MIVAIGYCGSIALLIVWLGVGFETAFGSFGPSQSDDELLGESSLPGDQTEKVDVNAYAYDNARDQLFEFSKYMDGSLYFAQNTVNKKESRKQKPAKKIKDAVTHSKKKTAAARKRARALEDAKRRSALAFVEYSCIGIIGFALLGLFLRYQKEYSESQSDLKDLISAPAVLRDIGYQAKAVVLAEPSGPDPLTYERTDVFQKIAGKQRPQSVTLDLSIDGPQLERSISSEIDQIISSIKITDKETEQKIPQMLLLPAEMVGHFEAMDDEVLVWSGPLYIKGVCEGMLAITNMRLLALYERRSFKLWPPSIIFKTKRNQILLKQMSLYKPVHVNRPSFLAAGAAIFWWFPFGTVGACIAIGAFLFVTRRELGIWTLKQKRVYPLSMVDLEEAMSSLGHITGVEALGRVEADNAKGKKAS